MGRASSIAVTILLALGAMVLNVAVAFGWVWVYSAFIDPGHPAAFYEAYAQRAAPWSSVIAGMPILFAAGWLLARWRGGGWRTGIWAGIAYVMIDAAILIAVGAVSGIALLSWVTKLAAAAVGGGTRSRRGA